MRTVKFGASKRSAEVLARMRAQEVRLRQRMQRLPRRARRALSAGCLVAVALMGLLLGLSLAGTVDAPVGPVQARLHAVPSLGGGVDVRVPPLGTVELHTNAGPLGVRVDVERLDPSAARRIVQDPGLIGGLPDVVSRDVRHALLHLVIVASLAALGGAALAGLVVYRSLRRALACGGVALAVVVASVSSAGLTFSRSAVREPRYTGMLASAPSVIGSAEDIADNMSAYGQQLGRLVTNVSRLYAAGTTLPLLPSANDDTRVLLVADLHLNPAAWPVIRSTVEQYHIDVVVDAGDLTDHGSRIEDAFAAPIGTLGVPYVFVKGNHDSPSTVRAVGRQRNAVVLSGTPVTVDGIRFLGAPDPRFTPDRENRDTAAEQADVTEEGTRLAGIASNGGADVAVVHDPLAGRQLAGSVPLVLAGHLHKRSVDQLEGGTTLITEGSTGGAGMRGLEHETPTPVELSVLYLDKRTHRLTAYDDITLGGLGLASANVERHVVAAPTTASVLGRTPRRMPSAPSRD